MLVLRAQSLALRGFESSRPRRIRVVPDISVFHRTGSRMRGNATVVLVAVAVASRQERRELVEQPEVGRSDDRDHPDGSIGAVRNVTSVRRSAPNLPKSQAVTPRLTVASKS